MRCPRDGRCDIGSLYQLWHITRDPTDSIAPYTPYGFTSAGRTGIAKASLTRDWGRREAVVVIPGADSVLDYYGRTPGPMDRRDITFSFTVWTNGDNDAAEDLLRAQVAPGYPQRLVYRTDSGALWFTEGRNPQIKQTSASENSWGYLRGGECNFAVTWRIRPDWRPQFSQSADVWGVNDGVWGTADGVWGGANAQALATDFAGVVADNTGTAGATLPTIADTGPTFTITGPFGGANGFIIFGSQTTTDANGNTVTIQVQVPQRVLANQSCILDFARQRFLLNGAPFRPIRPAYQREYLRIDPGVVNSFTFVNAGSGATVGGSVIVDWWKKRA